MAYVRVQGTNHENGVTTTPFCTLAGTVASGNNVHVAVSWSSGAGDTVTGITDDKGNVYTLVDLVREAGGGGSMQTAYRLNVTNAPITITATLSVADGFVAEVTVDEYSGEQTSGAIDGHAINAQAAPGTGANAITSTAITTAVNGDNIWGVSASLVGNADTVGTGFTLRQNNTTPSITTFTEDQTQASAGSIAATFTTAATPANSITAVMAFKAPAAGGTVTWGFDDAAYRAIKGQPRPTAALAQQDPPWPVITTPAPQFGWDNPERFAQRRRFDPFQPDEPTDQWPGTVAATPAQSGWDNPPQFAKRQRPRPVSKQDDPVFPVLATLTPTQQGFAWEPQFPIRRKFDPFQPDEPTDQWPGTVATTPSSAGFIYGDPQFPRRRKPWLFQPPLETWSPAAAPTPGPLAWDSPLYQAIRRKFAPFVGDPDLIIATVTPTGQIVVSYSGGPWRRRRSHPPQ